MPVCCLRKAAGRMLSSIVLQMKKIVQFTFSLFLFWLFFFACNRAIFLAVQFELLKQVHFGEVLASFRYAFPLDVSAACYSCALPFLLMMIAYATQRKIWIKLVRIVVLVFIFLHCAIAYGEAGLYTQWQSKLNYEALSHFAHPSEVFKTVSWWLVFLFIGCIVLSDLVFSVIYLKWVQPRKIPASEKSLPARLMLGLGVLAVGGFVILTGMRGGWKRFPISESKAYFSLHAVLNDAAVNPAWGLLFNLKQHAKLKNKNPYALYPGSVARAVADSLFHTPKDTTISVLTTTRPNIVFFILESWSADAIQNPEAQKIMPVFDSLMQQGIYFDHCYATGFISDQGVPGNLSAYPACYGYSICNDPRKTVHLPAINEVLAKAAGYHTGFIYGGQLDFGNIRGYIFNKKFDLVRDGMDFPSSVPRTSLGIPDAVMADTVASLLKKVQAPFFYSWYTLSSHMPYDIPSTPVIRLGSKEDAFLSSMHYADSAVGKLFEDIRNEPWYKNTLFVFVSDHSHDGQYIRPIQHKDRHRIPFLLYGDVIRPEWRGKVMHRIASQLDIVATLLAQMQLPHRQFPWSKDLFNPYSPQFAAYNFPNGAGIVTPEGFAGFDNRFPAFRVTDASDPAQAASLLRSAHILQQQAYNYFIKW